MVDELFILCVGVQYGVNQFKSFTDINQAFAEFQSCFMKGRFCTMWRHHTGSREPERFSYCAFIALFKDRIGT